MLDYHGFPVLAADIHASALFQVLQHVLIGCASMLHDMVVGHPVNVEMTDMGHVLGRNYELLPVNPLLVGNGRTYALKVSKPKIRILAVKVHKRIRSAFYRRSDAETSIEETVSEIYVACDSKHSDF